MKRFVIGSMIAATMIATGIQAQVVRKRQEAQRDRIAQGVASGQLTADETARLEAREANLNRTIGRIARPEVVCRLRNAARSIAGRIG